VLARNRGQHGESLLTMNVTHDPRTRTLQKYPRPFFVSDDERDAWVRSGGNPDSFLTPSIKISSETLSAAIDHVEKLADWIDSRLDRAMGLARTPPVGEAVHIRIVGRLVSGCCKTRASRATRATAVGQLRGRTRRRPKLWPADACAMDRRRTAGSARRASLETDRSARHSRAIL